MKIIRLESWLIVCALVLSTCTGCSTLNGKPSSDGRFNVLKRLSSKKEQEPEFKVPKSMVGIWKPSTYEKAGSKSIRGFGGRFYFYDANNDPVRVNGDLTIYGYDDQNQAESGAGKADRKFVFKADSLDSHFSKSAIGESYSFFKPTNAVVQASAEFPLALSAGSTVTSPIPRKKQVRRMPTTLRLTPHLAERLSSSARRAENTAAARSKDLSEETQSGNFDQISVSQEMADDKVKESMQGVRIKTKAPTRVFGQPGAFR